MKTGRGIASGVMATLGLVVFLAALGLLGAPAPAGAQESEEDAYVVPDSVFLTSPRSPVFYMSQYSRDRARGVWTQNIDYSRSVGRFALGMSGSSSTSEDLLGYASKNSATDFSGRLNWRATQAWVLSLDGRFSMNSTAEGSRNSSSEQRRNRLSIRSQYTVKPVDAVRFVLVGSSEFQQNFDLRLSERNIAPADTLDPDSLGAQRDSSFFSGRLDALRGEVNWDVINGITFRGVASGSRIRPTTKVRSSAHYVPEDGSTARSSVSERTVSQPADNGSLEGKVTYTGVRATTLQVESKRSGIDQVYFDLGQLQVEQYSNDTRHHAALLQTSILNPVFVNVTASMNRSLRTYEARPNLNALVTAREIGAVVNYTTPTTTISTNFTVNRTRAEQQATSNGFTLGRILTANATHRVLGRLWLVGLGSASLFSYQYLVPPGSNRTFSADDRDIANAFGSVGFRYAVTPRCSTAVNFSATRSHNVSIDATRSSGNFASTVYQINALVRLPLSRDVSISQNYILSANYQIFDYDELRNDLSRNFRIETTVADTLSRYAYVRLDHRYYFFDRGDFTPREDVGPRFYGVSQEQFQQILEGSVGIRPVPGVLLLAKQSLADTRNHDIVLDRRDTTKQWNLSLGLEVNRSFWGNAGLVGAVRHESRYQNLSTKTTSVNEEDDWIAAVTFQKEF